MFKILVAILIITFNAKASEMPVIATYIYPKLDRQKSLNDISDALGLHEKNGLKVKVVLYEKPSELAAGFVRGDISVAVTNLFSFFEVLYSNCSYEIIAVPSQKPNLVRDSYKSSIFSVSYQHIEDVKAFQDKGYVVTVYAVFKDSVSGGFLGANKLADSGIDQKKIKYSYVGSHQKVIENAISDPESIGIVSYSQLSNVKVNVLWVSDSIPFSPIICNPHKIDCEKLRKNAQKNQKNILGALKSGWPEYKNSQNIKQEVEPLHYKFYDQYVTFKKQHSE